MCRVQSDRLPVKHMSVQWQKNQELISMDDIWIILNTGLYRQLFPNLTL